MLVLHGGAGSGSFFSVEPPPRDASAHVQHGPGPNCQRHWFCYMSPNTSLIITSKRAWLWMQASLLHASDAKTLNTAVVMGAMHSTTFLQSPAPVAHSSSTCTSPKMCWGRLGSPAHRSEVKCHSGTCQNPFNLDNKALSLTAFKHECVSKFTSHLSKWGPSILFMANQVLPSPMIYYHPPRHLSEWGPSVPFLA